MSFRSNNFRIYIAYTNDMSVDTMVFHFKIDFQIQKNQFYAVSRTQQGMQREPNDETLRSLLPGELWKHCVEWRISTRFTSTPERR